MTRFAALACAALVISACASLSPRSRILDGLLALGLSDDRADCIATELDNRLESDDLNNVADFLDSLNNAASPGEGIDALLTIDNPRAAQAIARSGIACAF